MKKNLFVLSAMLTCVVSVFTSCVQSDMYEMYDEDGYFIPRGKKTKDIGGGTYTPQTLPSYSLYPLMYEPTFFSFECGATAVYNETGCSMVEARLAIINSQYGGLNGNSYGLYFLSVTGGANSCLPTPKDVLNSLNYFDPNSWEAVDVGTAIGYFRKNGREAFLSKSPAIAMSSTGYENLENKDGYRPHQATVTDAWPEPLGGNRVRYHFTSVDNTQGCTNWTATVRETGQRPSDFEVIGWSMNVFIWKK